MFIFDIVKYKENRINMKKVLFLAIFIVLKVNLLAQQIVVTYPNGGEVLVANSNNYIMWTDASLPQVKLEYSTNGGSSWNFIDYATSFSGNGFYSWSVPNILSTNCLVKVTNTANASDYDVSNSSFEIGAPYIILYYPNTFQYFAVGGSEEIGWYSQGVDFIDIEYSIDGGSTFIPIASNVDASLGQYTWGPIPNTPSSNCRVRLKQSSNALINDMSDYDFSIENPFITVFYPDGGESFIINTGEYIEWSSAGVSAVNIDYSIDGGVNWVSLATNFSSSWYWWEPIPNTPSSNCKVRVTDANNPQLNDESDGEFSIEGGSITLYWPSGGSSYAIGTTCQIWWDSPGISDVLIEFSSDSMATWSTIISNYTLADYYDWIVPNVNSNKCFIKVSNSNDLSVYGINDQPFSISSPTLTLLSPNGGETLQSGNMFYLSYDIFGIDSVEIDYSIDGGNSWISIGTHVYTYDGVNYFSWVVPNTPSNNCLLRVTDEATGLITDVSDFPFAIVFGGLPTCANGFFPPDGITSYSRNPILTWYSPITPIQVDAYDLYFGTNSTPPLYQDSIVNTSIAIQNLLPATTYYWKVVPKSVNGDATGCVINSFTTSAANEYNMDNQTENTCSGTFYDFSGPWLDYRSEEDYTKTFFPSTAGQVLKFDFDIFETEQSYDKLTIYDGVDVNAPIIGTYSGVNGPGAVVATNPQGALTFLWHSDYTFNLPGWSASISCVSPGTQTITLMSPNGGESWIGNTSKTISWIAQNITNVDLQYSIDSGNTWLTIATNLVNTGSYNWQVPLPASTNCFVKVISSNNPAVFDVSNARFEIQYVPIYIDLISPNTAQTFLIGTNTTIYWQSMFVSSVNIEYSIDAGNSWLSIISGLATSDGNNYYSWTIPATPSNLCLVRVSDATNPAINDFSQSAFYIVEPYLEVFSPNGGEVLNGNTYTTITWKGYLNTNAVKIQYSNNNGLSWNTIASNIYHINGNTMNYSWFVNNTNSSNCRVKVSQVSDTTVFDESNNVFTINSSVSQIEIIQANGGEVLSGGLNYSFQWSSSFVSGNFKVQLSTNNGSSWTTLANNVINSGYFNWLVPNLDKDSCLLKVSDALDTTIFDVSDGMFSIAQTIPSITNITPGGGEILTAGSYVPITWNSVLVPLVDILFSSDGGNTYTTIITNLNNINYFHWLVPTVVSTDCRIKVRAAGNSNLFDVSQANFSIIQGTPFISVVQPNGGESFIQNTAGNIIKWSGSGIGSIIKLEYSADGGVSWNTIINSFASANNMYYWFTPNIISSQCLVKVTSVSNPALFDISDAEFSIGASTPTLTVVSPNGGEYLNQGYWFNITWNRYNVPLIDLSFSDDNGTTWNPLITGVNADSYYWNVPNISSTQCLVKVEKAGTGTPLNDISNAVFTIGPALPNSNTLHIDSIVSIPFCKLDTFYVYYTANGTYNAGNSFDVQLSDSVGNFNNATLIGHIFSTANSGVIPCIVPTTIGNGIGYRIRIQSSNLPATSIDNGFDIIINSPQFDFAANQLIKYLPDGAVTFFVIPPQSPTATYSWDFGDGATSTSAQPTHNYSTIGKFDVSLTIEDAGCIVSVDKTNYIRVEQLFPSYSINTNTLVDITDVSMLTPDTALMTLRDGSCIRSFDGGLTWTPLVTGLTAGVDTLLSCDVYPNIWRVVGSNGKILESQDNGQSWIPMNSNTTQRMYGVATFDNNKAFAVADSGVIVNYDGNQWTQQNTGITTRFWDVAVDKSSPAGNAYAVGGAGVIFKYDGTNWNPQVSGISVSLFGTSVIGNDTVYAVGGVNQGIILKTTDGGQNWNTVLSGVDVSFRSVTGIADTAWASATDGIVYETRDGGLSWVRYSTGNTLNNNGIAFKKSKGLVVGTNGHGRAFGLQTPPDTTLKVKQKFYAPDQLILFPNPAQHLITLKGKFDKSTEVYFSIKDIEGKEVMTLPKQIITNGVLNYSFNTDKLSNGIYFVFVNDGINYFVKRLVISR